MKKISRRSFITAMAAVSAAGVLAACGSSSSSTASSVASSAVSSEATFSAASMDETGTHTVVDHGGNEVEVPNKVTRVVIDQIPILSTYMAYFEGSAPYIVGYCGSFKSVISDTVLKNIAPELLESSDTVYAQSDLNIEEIMKLNPDVILYNAGNSSHAEILKASGIPSIGFATVGASTEADPIERYEEWLKLLEQIHNFTVLDADVFAILSADFKHGIDFRHPMSRSLGLRSDLIPDSICSDAFADALSS